MFNKLYEKIKNFFLENYKFLIVLTIVFLFFFIELPYVVYAPGGSIDLSDRIEVENAYETEGKLQMAYVTMIKGSTPFVLLAKILPNWDIVSKSEVMYNNENTNDMLTRDKINLKYSKDTAIIEAYKLTDKKVEIINTYNNIIYIDERAVTDLKIGDILLEANGIKINNLDEYKKIVESLSIEDEIDLKILRNNKEKKCKIKVFDTENGLKTGISIITTYDYETKPKITIKNKSSESGPSGGLMMALSIYNTLVENDITKGRNIIGTGTIEENGVVGEISGIKYKLIGAINNKADIFICPAGDNYEEAIKIKKEKGYDINIIGVSTLEQAIHELSK